MSRNSVFLPLAFVLSIFLLLTSVGLPVAAASPAQQGGIPDDMRHEQDSYHGREDIPIFPSSSLLQLDLNPTSDPVYVWSKVAFESYVNGNWEIYFGAGNFSQLTRLTDNNDVSDIHPRLDRGATRIVFASDRERYTYEIFTMATDGTALVRLTDNYADDVSPAWSPNGTRIAFQSYRDGNSEIYVMNANGTGQTRLTNNTGYDGEPTWSPDGTRIAFTTYRNSQYRIWVMDADGTDLYQLSNQPYSELPVWSPDGRKIAFDADADYDDMMELWVMDADGTNQNMLYESPTTVTMWANGWSPDNTRVTFTAVHLVYYYGYWYWDNAWLYKITLAGDAQVVNTGRNTDWFLDWTTTTTQPPTVGMSPQYAHVPYQFTVNWWGQDSYPGGIYAYDVQVKDNPQGAWTDWAVGTVDTSGTFTGVGGHEYLFRVRAWDMAFNISPWPANYHASFMVERKPPITSVAAVKPYLRGNSVRLGWNGTDPGDSGISSYDIQTMDQPAGAWDDWLIGTNETNALFSGALGQTYSFRSIGHDNAFNVEIPPEEGDASTTFFAWSASGYSRDNTGVPVAGMLANINPAAFLFLPSNRDGLYSSFLSTYPPVKTVTWSKDGYGSLPPTDYGVMDACVDVYLPPVDNIIQDFGFESGSLPSAWQVGGDFTPTVTSTMRHSGMYAASLGTPFALNAPITLDPAYGAFGSMFADEWGNLHVARSKYAPSQTYTIYYDKRLPDGTWLPTEYVAQVTGAAFWGLGIAVDSGQNVHILYNVYNVPATVSAVMRDPGGTWSTPQVIISSSASTWMVGMEVDDNSTVHAVINGYAGLYYAYHDLNTPWQVEDIPTTPDRNDVAFSLSPDGQVYLAWTSYNENAYFRSRDLAGNWGDLVTFSRPGYARYIDMVVDSTHTPYIMWHAGFPEAIYFTTMDPAGTWLDPVDISAGMGGFAPRLLVDQDDHVYALWSDNSVADEIVFSQLDIQGNWSNLENISNSAAPSAFVEAAVSPGGEIFAAWKELVSGQYWTWYAWRHAGVWSVPVMLDSEPSDSPSLQVVRGEFGGAHVAWRAGTSYNNYVASVPAFTQEGSAWISQPFTVPPSMADPTLSFLAYLSGVSPVSGNQFVVQVTDELTTTALFIHSVDANWEHFWFDLTPWSGEYITLTFRLTEHEYFPPAHALLDEVTLGTAHTDAWVNLAGEVRLARPGDQLSFMLDYGNRSSVLAVSSTITLTLPAGLSYVDASVPPQVIGQQLIWQVGDLDASMNYDSILLDVQVDAAAPLFQSLLLETEINTISTELELLNNVDVFDIFLGYWQHLTLIRR